MTRGLVSIRALALAGLAAAAMIGGCRPKAEILHRVQVDPIRVEPIEINATIRIQVERELEDIFDYKDRYHMVQTPPDDGAADPPPGGMP